MEQAGWFSALTGTAKEEAIKKLKIHIFELTYASKFRYLEAKQRKATQHDYLINCLRHAGWKVNYTTMVLGTDGTIFKSTVDTLKQLLPTQPDTVERTLTKLNKNAVLKAHDILVTRRIQEKILAAGYPPACKRPG